MDIPRLSIHSFGLLLEIAVFLALAVTKSRQQDNFYFDPAPLDQDIVEGDELRLRCDVSNRKHIQFYWMQDNKKIANTSRRFQEDSDLYIKHVDRTKDSGSFRCIATNVTTGVSLQSTGAKLNILWINKTALIELKIPEDQSEVEAGVDLSLKCGCTGNPEPDVEWFLNKLRIFPSDRVRFHKNRMKLTGITVRDNGVYSCRARNLAGMVESSGEQDYLLNLQGENAAHLNAGSFKKMALLKKGSTVVLDCEFDNALLTEWYFKQRRLKNQPNKITVHNNGSLVIEDVQDADEGAYKCVGISEEGPDQNFVSDVKLAYLRQFDDLSFEPRLPPSGNPQVVPLRQKYEVICEAPEGLPTPTQRWVGPEGAPLPLSGRIQAVGGVLTITNAMESDTGNYTCIVENMARTRQQNVWVVVSVQPRIVRPPLSMRVVEDELAMFDCTVVGTRYPVTKITWRKIGATLDRYDPNILMDEATGTLTIRKVGLRDEGNYACLVNTTGHPVVTSINAHLYVTKKLKFKPVPVNTKLELDSVSKIHCNADGQQPPQVHWSLQDGSQDFPAHIRDQQGTLMFDKVQKTDKGTYVCTASSSQGTINATIYVDVVRKPWFKMRPANTTAYEGYPVMIHCVATGDPQPTIKWDKNLQMDAFDPTRVIRFPNGSLYISEVYMEDMGKYGCTAGNSGGFERTEIYLHVTSSDSFVKDHRLRPPNMESFNMMKTIIIAVCSAVAYLAIVIGLTVYCSIRLVKAKNLRKQQKRESAAAGDKAENGTVPTEHTELMDKKDRDSSIVKSDDARSHVSGVSSHHSNSQHSSAASSRGRAGFDRLAFPRHNLQTLGMLGKGHYGDVFLAKAHGIVEGELETLVVVKSLLTREEMYQFDFRREVEMLGKLHHENIVRLLGTCREMEPQFIITEYCDWGDLKQFLWATRKDNGKRNVKLPPLTMAQKVNMCRQIALALEHMANNRYVHRDVAVRNVLLSSGLDLKLSTLSLCRDVYASEYYPCGQRLVPLRWLAPEAALEDEYSTKSDVWAFGVFIWEVFTLGDLPYKLRTDEAVLQALKTGDCGLEPLSGCACPEEMMQLVNQCMCERPQDRPSFSEIVLKIGDMTVDSDV